MDRITAPSVTQKVTSPPGSPTMLGSRQLQAFSSQPQWCSLVRNHLLALVLWIRTRFVGITLDSHPLSSCWNLDANPCCNLWAQWQSAQGHGWSLTLVPCFPKTGLVPSAENGQGRRGLALKDVKTGRKCVCVDVCHKSSRKVDLYVNPCSCFGET